MVGWIANRDATRRRVLANFFRSWLNSWSGSQWTHTPYGGWTITILCLVMLFAASFISSRIIRILIAVGVIAVLANSGLIASALLG